MHHETGVLDDGRPVTYEFFRSVLTEEMEKIREEVGEEAYAAGNYERAAELMDKITREDEFESFLTLEAYREID